MAGGPETGSEPAPGPEDHHHQAPRRPHNSDGKQPQVMITPECPVQCLQTALSLMSLNRLAAANGAFFDPPRTVADVIELHRHGKLQDIRGLGRRRISEIEAAIVFLGLDISGHHHR
jgi:hypothetical protein